MTLFALPVGYRVALVLNRVGIFPEGASLEVDRRVRVDATATDHFEIVGGQLRRRFADCVPRIADHTDDLWMTDGPSLNYSPDWADAWAAASNWDI